MKVKELIAELNKLNPELEVLCYSEDAALLPQGHMFRLLTIDHVNESQGQKLRDQNDIATLKFGKGTDSAKLALISVTSDF